MLRDAGIPFQVKTVDTDESYPRDLPVEAVAQHIAQNKARAAATFIERGDEIILAADSVVVLDGEIFGKPSGVEDAKRILRRLSGRVHEVFTGVCLLSKQKEKLFTDCSRVHFHPITEEEIAFYIEQFRPFDKAGSYGIQDWIGLCKVRAIEGSYANIMGLPIDRVYHELKAWQLHV